MLMENLFKKSNNDIGKKIVSLLMALMLLITSSLLNIINVDAAEVNYPNKMIKITAPNFGSDSNPYSIMTKKSLTAGHTYRLEMYQNGILGVKYNFYANGTTWTQNSLTGTTVDGLTTYEFTPTQNYAEIRINIGGTGKVSYIAGLKLYDTASPDTNLINDPGTSGNFGNWCRGMLNQNQMGYNGTSEIVYGDTATSMDSIATLVDFDKTVFGLADSSAATDGKMLHLVTRSWGEHGTFINAASMLNKTYRLSFYFKGEGGNGDYALRLIYYTNNWSVKKSMPITKNEIDEKTGLHTQEFTVPAEAENLRLFVNEGSAAGANIWVHDVKLIDITNPLVPSANLQSDWLTKWSGNNSAELVDIDMSKFASKNYDDKMLHLKTSSWGEYGTSYLSATDYRGKNFRLTYYFKGEGGNGDYSMRVTYWYENWAKNKNVTFTKNEVDSKTGMYTQEFTVPDDADAIKIYINQGSAANADIWVSDVSLIDIANPTKELQGDWLSKWSGKGTAEIIDKDLSIFLPQTTANKMLHLKTVSWGEYGTSFLNAANYKGKTFRLTYYFKGEGGRGDYGLRVMYWYENWAKNKSVTFTKNEVNTKTGMHTMEFTVPDEAHNIKIHINQGSAADADIWVSDVSLIDIANPDEELQGDWLSKWSGKGVAELVDKDLEIFKPIDYSTKTLKITSTAEWAEFKGHYELTIGKSYEFSYYFKYETENKDDTPSIRILSGNTSLNCMIIEDDDYNKFVIRFTVPEKSTPISSDSTKAKITILLNEGKHIGNQMWFHFESLVDVEDPEKTDLAEDKFHRWTGSGNKDLSEFDKEEFLKTGSSSKTQYMLVIPSKAAGVEYGTSAMLKPNEAYRLTMYYSDKAEDAVKVYYKNQSNQFTSLEVKITKKKDLYLIYYFDFTVPSDAKINADGDTEIFIRLVSNKNKTVYCYMPRLAEKDAQNEENLIRDPGLMHNFKEWNSFRSGTEETVSEMYNFNFSGFDSGKFVLSTSKTMIKAEAIYRMATFGVSPSLKIGKTYEFSMYCCGVKTSEFHIYYYDKNYNWKGLVTDSETYSETELFKTYVFTVPDDALKTPGTNTTSIHLRFSSGEQGSVNYLYKTTLVDVKNKKVNLINDPSLSHSFDGWYVINYESPGFPSGGAVNGLSLVALDMKTFVDDSSDRPFNDGEWIKLFGIKQYLLGFDDSFTDDMVFDDFTEDDGSSSKKTIIRKRRKVFLPQDYTWIVISAIAGVVVIAGGVTAFIIIRKKKRKVSGKKGGGL